MRSRVTFLRHPLHPILVMFPVAMLPLLLILDLVILYVRDEPGLWTAGLLTAAIGGALTLAAMIPGIVDLAAIPDGTTAHRRAVQHLIVGIIILVLYAASVYFRWPMGSTPPVPTWVVGVDAVGTLAVVVQGWLGGELVYKHHIGVDGPEEGGEPTRLKEGPGLHIPPARETKRRHPR